MIRFAISLRNDDDLDYQEGDHWINSDDDHDVMTHNDDDHTFALASLAASASAAIALWSWIGNRASLLRSVKIVNVKINIILMLMKNLH